MNTVKERNVEYIRRKNLEDNQLFLEKLLMDNIRNDFISSARSILRKNPNDQTKKRLDVPQQKVDRSTRYSEKVKSGEIPPFVPEWQRLREQKKIDAQQRLIDQERRKEERLREIERRKEEKLQEIERKKEERLREIERRQQERLQEIERRKERLLQKQKEQEEKLFIQELKKIEREIIDEEKRKIQEMKRRLRRPPKWTLFYTNSPNGNPYQRVYKPRNTKVGQRAEQNFI